VEKTIRVIRELKEKKIIKDFAIGGGIAVLYYIEPLLTYDLDIFFIPIEESLDVLSPIYKQIRDMGYKTQMEYIIIEGVPVQFIPVYNELIRESVQNAAGVRYGRLKTKVIGLEYLVAIMIQTFRPVDRERLLRIFDETEINLRLLNKILKKYRLFEKYQKFRKSYFGEKT
jgi:hypothetical protein